MPLPVPIPEIPAYAALASFCILLFHVGLPKLLNLQSNRNLHHANLNEDDDSEHLKNVKIPGQERNIQFIYAWRVLKLIGCLTMLGLTIGTTVARKCGSVAESGGVEKGLHLTRAVQLTYLLFVYASCLALVSLSPSVGRRWKSISLIHLEIILLIPFSLYVYRDIVPLGAFDKTPVDICEGAYLWSKIGVLGFTSVIIPLFSPREYVPVDPKNPVEPSPDQTCSLFSLICINFMSGVIFAAKKVEHLPFDQFPPLADWDWSSHLRDKYFKHLDIFSGAKKRRLFWGILRSFWWTYIQAFLWVAPIQGSVSVLGPFALNQLLKYMETDGQNATIRPWVWIIGLFLSPVLEAVSFEWYFRVLFHTEVRIEALVQQLVFEQALRMRIKNDAALEAKSDVNENSNTTRTSDDGNAGSSTDTNNANNSSKGKGKTKTKDKPSQPQSQAQDAEGAKSNVYGKINNLVTNDLQTFMRLTFVFIGFGTVPIELTLYAVFLYSILGWSALVGIGLTILLAPVPSYLTRLGGKVQAAKMKKTDARVQTFSDTINVLRMVKLFGWEVKMRGLIGERREDELVFIRKGRTLEMGLEAVNLLIAFVTMGTTFAVHAVVRKQELTASIVFSSMTIFETFGQYVRFLFSTAGLVISANISMNRITDFLHNTELIDDFTENPSSMITTGDVGDAGTGASASPSTSPVPPEHIHDTGFCNATFAWSKDSALSGSGDGTSTPLLSSSRRRFLLKVEDKLVFKQGHLNLILGPTGSGKTALLLALLGEMHFVPPTTANESWVNLPREGGVAYAPQESWVLNQTIKENIVFNSDYNEDRYQKVLYQCALERDLSLFKAGDQTEVGERGQTLSGGQKARLTLARAVYSKAQIVILDDILAALDVHTAKWVVEKCLAGDLLEGRTIIMVTHNIDLVQPLARFIVTMKDGRVVDQDHVSAVHKSARDLVMKLKEELDESEAPKPEDTEDQKAKDGKLVMDEEIVTSRRFLSSLTSYFSALGGGHPLLFLVVVILGFALVTLTTMFQTWYLGYWASQYEYHSPEDMPVLLYLGRYGLLFVLILLLDLMTNIYYIYCTVRASRFLHQSLVKSITLATFGWLDRTPISRIITRVTEDIGVVDDTLPRTMQRVIVVTINLLFKLGAVVLFTPVFLLPGVLALALGYWLGSLYLKSQTSTRREKSVKKAPVLGLLGSAIHGVVSIRAYGVQSTFRKQFQGHIDHYSRASRTMYDVQRWIAFRLPLISGTFVSLLATYLLYASKQSASTTGFSLNMAVSFTRMIFSWLLVSMNLEVQTNSLERIDHYLKIEHEVEAIENGQPPAYWPASGDLRVEKLSAKYSPDGPEVLHEISFHIRSGERIGVVGRTGSGKSTLTLSLLRCIHTTGDVIYDGVATSSINLDSLRSNITIVPQMPELISGTLRQNLDPFGDHDDFLLNDALRSAGLTTLQEDMAEEDRITLDTAVSAGGSNFSLGQRQIVALARAIVRQTTSAIDYKTDNIIQHTLRTEFKGDTTMITIAHRLQTIMDADRIMVLDAGNIVEFDAPKVLLENKSGLLRALVDESHDRDILLAMAGL
ncbi:hypothetical protein D9758_006918 [Tetrapyrgos nigripes]|uniref:P-loop containing nucleoside triphosphate hydrolase protein n=1 Tax=Tetrapyrgos nigripes TaxID=182062 RepID=A0A8H5GST2_9AGAR|nr:hypothetical protein D9758_006918 [Tetrapyrgos nigripes]